jgi:hypothetical protein
MSVSGELITAGANLAGDYLFNKGARKEAEKAAKAQRTLFNLQAEEQRLKNEVLKQSLNGQDRRLPFEVSLPGPGYGTAAIPQGAGPAAATAPAPQTAAAGPLVALAVAGVLLMLVMKGSL